MYVHLDELEALYGNSNKEVEVFASPFEKTNTQRKSYSFPKIRLPKMKLISEVKTLIILFLIVFSGFFFFTNAKLVLWTINDTFTEETQPTASDLEAITEHHSADQREQKVQKLNELEEQFTQLQKNFRTEEELAPTMKEFLDKKQETHTLNFNTLPPSNRLIIPDLNINIPLVDVPIKGEEDFSEGQFDDELMQGAVKYPTTPIPGNQGNSLIFWHSSTERWKHNEYGFVFRNLPRLQAGQKFQIIWNGQLTTYEMVERKIVLPKQVPEYYHEIQDKDGSFVTLMGCYPIGSNAKRMMVVAKKVANE